MSFTKNLALLLSAFFFAMSSFAETCNEDRFRRKQGKIYMKAERAYLNTSNYEETAKQIAKLEKLDLNCYEYLAVIHLKAAYLMNTDDIASAATLLQEWLHLQPNLDDKSRIRTHYNIAVAFMFSDQVDYGLPHLIEWLETYQSEDQAGTPSLPTGATTSKNYLSNIEFQILKSSKNPNWKMTMASALATHHKSIGDEELAAILETFSSEQKDILSTKNYFEFKRPRPINGINVRYPGKAESRGIEGTCEVTFDLSREGMPSNVVAECSRDMFIEAAETAIANATFEPALKDGNPIELDSVVYPLDFSLE